MNLFIDAVSKNGVVILFDEKRNQIDALSLDVSGNESQKLTENILSFLQKNSISFTDITEIIVVNGPGSFTGIRAIVLTVNTFAFIYPHLKLTDISYFDLFTTYPIIKQSSKRDVFFLQSKGSSIEVLSNEQCNELISSSQCQKISGDFTYLTNSNILIEKEPNYGSIYANVECKGKKKIEPLYVKKPNIT